MKETLADVFIPFPRLLLLGFLLAPWEKLFEEGDNTHALIHTLWKCLCTHFFFTAFFTISLGIRDREGRLTESFTEGQDLSLKPFKMSIQTPCV